MKNILLMNKIAACGTARFGEGYAVSDSVSSPDGIMVRSANLLDTTFDPSLQAIARAVRASTTSPATVLRKKAWWCSTLPAPTPTP